MEVLIGIVGSVAAEIGKSMVTPIKRHIGYLIFYNRNIKNLQDEIKKLDDKRAEADLFVQDADKKFKVPIPGVPHWKKEADELNLKVSAFLEKETHKACNKCFNGCYQNPCSRYSSSRKAFKMTIDIHKKNEDAPEFSNVAYDAPLPNLGSTFNIEGLKDFESRYSVINDVWEALENDNLSMIGICGMGGVGKTTLVKKLVKKVEIDSLFGVVAMVVVSRKPNSTIQDEIVEQLGLEIKEKTLEVRASKLYEWIMNCEKNFLLILDDVWDEVDFEAIGLPLRGDKKGYKIVLTSRNGDLCSKIGSEKNFSIHILTKEEAWDLFREMAGNSIDGTLLHKASEIANECGGLPIAIVTLAKALERKSIGVWEDALLQLKKSNMKGIPGMQKVYSKLELSFDLLEFDEAKACFLLCCMFPEDYNVPVDDLVYFGMGLGLFRNIENVHEARNRVCVLIDQLKESFLLLDGDSFKIESVKMHDLLRDVAISIASKHEHAYLVSCDSEMNNWPGEADRYKDCVAISLLRSEINLHPVDLEFPKLQLLRLSYGNHSQPLPNNFFEGIKEVKVLSLAIPLLPKPFDVLKKLRTLHLKDVESEEMSSIGALISLEILQIGGRTSFKKLPSEIGLLRNLRVLNLREMVFLEYIPSGVLSGLSKLEELYVTRDFKKWECIEDGKTNASLKELESQPITALEVCVPNPLLLPKEPLFRNLIRFKILIGRHFNYNSIDKGSTNLLGIESDGKDVIASGISSLLTSTEALGLTVDNLENSLLDIVEMISHSQEISELQNKNPVQLPYFNNLKHIHIEMTNGMKYVFPVSVARGLNQLQGISIVRCFEIEGIFYGDNEKIELKDNDVELPSLKYLRLSDLRNLIGFWVDMGNNAVVDQLRDGVATKPSMNLKISTNNQVPRGQELHPQLQHGSSHCIYGPVFLSHGLQPSNLQTLSLSSCDSLKVVFSTSIAGQLMQLKTLHLERCYEMEYVVAGREEEEEGENKGTTKIVLPMLKFLHLSHLPNLVALYPEGHTSFHLPSLETLWVKRCRQMKTFCPTFPSPVLNMKNSVHTSPLPSNEPTVQRKFFPHKLKTFFPLRSIISRITRRSGREQKSKDSTLQPQSSNKLEEVSLMESDYSSSHSYDRMEACCAFPFKSMEGFGNLKEIHLKDGPFNVLFSFDERHVDGAMLRVLEELHLDDLSGLTHIWFKFPSEITAFQNLQVLYIKQCHCLNYIFPPHVVKLLVKLEDLSIEQCDRMETIVLEEEEEKKPGKIVLPQLRSLRLRGLNNLKSFYNDSSATIEFSLLEHLILSECDRLGTLFYGSVITLSREESSTGSILEEKEETGNIDNVAETCSPFSITSIEGMRNLKRLEVQFCQAFEVIFLFEESREEGVLDNLENLELKHLPNLEHVWLKIPQEIKAFQNLKELYVESCNRLKYLFSTFVAKLLVKLEKLIIRYCETMEAIVVAEEEEEKRSEKIVFPQLRKLELEVLSNLRSFCIDRLVTIELPLLEDFTLGYCYQMKIFSYGSVITPKLKKMRKERKQFKLKDDLNATMQKITAVFDFSEDDEQDDLTEDDEQDLTEDEQDDTDITKDDEQDDLTEDEEDVTNTEDEEDVTEA